MRLLLLVLALLVAPAALAQPGGAIDVRIALAPDEAPRVEAPPGVVRVEEATSGARYAFNLTLTREYTTFEVRAVGLDLDRARQLVPSLALPDDKYPLFFDFPNERIWEVDGPGRVVHANGSGRDATLRLGIPGPTNVTLVLTVDKTPPAYTLGDVQRVTHIGFYQETTTDELALADLQVRPAGSEAPWVQNPTPEYHYLQRFPVQGLDPERTYDVRVTFTDWAQNSVTTSLYQVTTSPLPPRPLPTVRPVAPAPNASVAAGDVVVEAVIESPESPVGPEGVRLFFDKREVSDRISFSGNTVRYTPTNALAPGPHSVAVEVTNAAGGFASARWSFEVAGANEAPLPLLAPLGLAASALLLRRRT